MFERISQPPRPGHGHQPPYTNPTETNQSQKANAASSLAIVKPQPLLRSYILGTLLTFTLLFFAFAASSASAEITCSSCKPWWHINSGSEPTNIPPGGEGKI